MRQCIPSYRLPNEILDVEVSYILGLGIDVRTNIEVGKDITLDQIMKEYDAVFISTGASKSLRLNIEGENLEGVFHALEFLREVKAGKISKVGSRVIVIGGGNVAVDAARTARRLGSEDVLILYRRTRAEMPAHSREVNEAEDEGVKIRFLAAPIKIIGEKGKVTAVECIQMKLGPPDETGRRRPIPIEGSEFTLPADTVIIAIGEEPDVSFLPQGIEVGRRNRIVVDPVTLETNIKGVFAGGDVVTGPKSVIDAIAAGKRAAVSIDRYLRGQDLKAGREEKILEFTWVKDLARISRKSGKVEPLLPSEERIKGFSEVRLGFTLEEGLAESRRCLLCGPCIQCIGGENEELCPPDLAIVDEGRCIGCANCEKVCEYGAIKVDGKARVDELLCKGCGTCVVECPAMAINMKNYSNEKLASEVQSTLASLSRRPKVLAFLCDWGAQAEEEIKQGFSQNVGVIKVKCSGRVDFLYILQAFRLGVDGVFVCACRAEDCHFGLGSLNAERRMKWLGNLLEEIGLGSERLRLGFFSVGEEHKLREAISDFIRELEEIGSNPFV